mmetsp:Transcript_17064/g.30996  ORF Transcript_17064/g.30996 Transcript_17064/m.30996 type:complete len:80 (-) Transcript_17064:353-592(-)
MRTGRRWYMTPITVTDEARLTNSAECYVEVAANGNGNGTQPITDAPGESTQLFLLDSFSSKDYIPDTPAVQALPLSGGN